MLHRANVSIRYKVLIVAMATTLAALFVTGVVMAVYELRTYKERSVNDLTAQADIVGRASAAALAFDDQRTARDNLASLKVRPKIVSAALYNEKGRLFAEYMQPGSTVAEHPQFPEVDGFRIARDEIMLFKRIVENNEILGIVLLRARYELMERLWNYAGILAGVMVLGLLVALLLSTWLQTGITGPILAVSDAARRVVESRDFTLRVKKTSNDEIGYLVDAFNDMLAEIGRRAEALEASNLNLRREVQERERAEENLRELNTELEKRVADRTAQLESANRELEGFSYSVSHDLRAPLRAITGFAAILEEDHAHKLDAEGRRLVDVVQREARRMGTLIDDLLAFSRLGRKSLQLREIDMTELVRSTFDGLRPQSDGARPDFRLSVLPPGFGDRVLIGQVWANLLANAVKFTSRRETPVIEVSGIADDAENVYFVRDNGAGFDPRHRAKLFGVFQRLHDAEEFPGTGVGLALVQRIVHRHGGRVWADGVPDQGATFYFTLPKGSDHG